MLKLGAGSRVSHKTEVSGFVMGFVTGDFGKSYQKGGGGGNAFNQDGDAFKNGRFNRYQEMRGGV